MPSYWNHNRLQKTLTFLFLFILDMFNWSSLSFEQVKPSLYFSPLLFFFRKKPFIPLPIFVSVKKQGSTLFQLCVLNPFDALI
jgi:hypothetical protein